MKKQILFMMFLSLAFVFAGVNKSYGQCEETKFNPVPGKEYTYTADVSPEGGGYNWYVVEASDGVELVGATGITDADIVTIADNTVNPVEVTWGPNSVGNTYLLVIEYTDTEGCGTNNIKAWEIEPLNSFEIIVENIDVDNVLLTEDVCRDNVESAIYSGGDITYDYGENSFYLRITASNYANNWTPTVVPSGETDPQSFTVAGYFESDDFTGTPIDMATATSVDVIYVKIDLDHGAYEGLSDQTLTFEVTAVDDGGNNDVDLDDDCNVIDEDDTVNQVLGGRPTVTSATEEALPDGEGFVTP